MDPTASSNFLYVAGTDNKVSALTFFYGVCFCFYVADFLNTQSLQRQTEKHICPGQMCCVVSLACSELFLGACLRVRACMFLRNWSNHYHSSFPGHDKLTYEKNVTVVLEDHFVCVFFKLIDNA